MKNFINKIVDSKYFSYILLLITLFIGLYLRIRAINTDLWYDEVFTAITVKQDWSQMINTIIADAVHPPTYYILLKVWATIFSYDATSLRSFSIFFGILLLPIVFYIGRLLSQKNDKYNFVGLLSSFMLSISPFFIQYSVEVRSYMFITFLGFLLLLLFLKINNTDRIFSKENINYWILFILLFIFTIFTHYLNTLLLTGYIIAIVIRIIYENRWNNIRNFWFYLWIFFLLLCFIIIIFADIIGVDEILSSRNYSWMGETDLTTIFRSLSAYLFGVYNQYPGVPRFIELIYPIKVVNISFIVFITVIISLISIWKDNSNNKKLLFNIISLTAVTLVPLIVFNITSSFGITILIERYAIISGSYLILWLVYIFYEKFRIKTLIIVLIYILLLLIHPGVPKLTKYSLIEQKIDIISKRDNINNIVIDNRMDFLVLNYYLNNKYKVKVMTDRYEPSWALVKEEDGITILDECQSNCIYITYKTDLDLEKIDDVQGLYVYRVK